jgi:CRP-like cAMP-binding protein
VQASNNSLIAQLTKPEQVMMLRHAEEIVLLPGDVIASPDIKSSSIYFPVSGSIALYVTDTSPKTSNGLALGLVGPEGAVGLQSILGLGVGNFQLLVQSAGGAYVVKTLTVQRLIKKRQKVMMIFFRYLWTLYEEIVDLAFRAHTQDIHARLANWLLISKDCCKDAHLHLTQEHMAKMLGVRRSTVTLAAHDLKMKRYIKYSRGTLELLNVSALKALSNR